MAKKKKTKAKTASNRGNKGGKLPCPKGWKWPGVVLSRFGYKPVIKDGQKLWLAASETDYREGMAKLKRINPAEVNVPTEEEWLKRGCIVDSLGLCITPFGGCPGTQSCGWVLLTTGSYVCLCRP